MPIFHARLESRIALCEILPSRVINEDTLKNFHDPVGHRSSLLEHRMHSCALLVTYGMDDRFHWQN